MQVFRHGSIEAVEVNLLYERNANRYVSSAGYERELLKALPRFLSVQQQLGVEPPLVVMLSLLGVKGYILYVNARVRFQSGFPFPVPIDRDSLLVPEPIIQTFDCDPTTVMRPIFLMQSGMLPVG